MKSLKVNCALITTLLFWASAFVGIRIGLESYSPGSLALLRFLVASVCMGIIYYCLPGKKRLTGTDRILLLFIGVVGIGIYNICLNIGETVVSAGIASFIIGLMPVFTIILSILFLGERPGRRVGLGILISFVGLFLLVLSEKNSTVGIGVLLILVSAFCGSFYSITQKRFLRNYHPVAITAWVIWGGTLFLLWFILDLWHELPRASFKATGAAVYMGIFPAALAYVAWCYVLNHLPASSASIYLYALPVLSTVMGCLILKEYPSWLSLMGGSIALIGAFIANRKKKPVYLCVQSSRITLR